MDQRTGTRPASWRLRRRRNLLIAVIFLAVVASVGGLLVSTAIKSPAQQAAAVAAPPATQLTAPVTRQTIADTITAQGVVKPPPEISQPDGASGSGGGSGQLSLVTRVYRHPGSVVEPGNVLVEVAGRPLFVFEGSVPAYRSLVPGDSGTDVTQLQNGLQQLGFGIGSDTSGHFGPGTASAVSAYYKAIGYPAKTISSGPKAAKEPMVPLAEIMFVSRFPAQVVTVAGPVGAKASGSLATLAIGDPTIAGQLLPSGAPLVRSGMAVTISDPATGRTVHGTVGSVGTRTATKGSISGGIYVPFTVDPNQPLPISMAGQDVTLTIARASSNGPVLAVPEAAVFARADGRLYVTKVTGPHAQVQVPVRIDLTGNGMVGVTPLGGASLAPGDQVVTGLNYAGARRSPQ